MLFGPPGCGKGAFGAKIAQHFGICQVSVGKLIQEAAASDGEVRALLERGEQIPDNVLNPLVFGALSKQRGYVLDGYPRTDLQAFALKAHTQPTHVIEFAGVAEKDTPEMRVYNSTLNGIRDVFRPLLTVVSLKEDPQVVEKTLLDIVSGRRKVLDKVTREVLPRGPGLVSAQQEAEDLNFCKVKNTKPKIEEVE